MCRSQDTGLRYYDRDVKIKGSVSYQDRVMIELFEDSGLKIRIEASIFHLAPVRIW